MQRDHQGWRTLRSRNLHDKPFGSAANRRESALARVSELMVDIERNASLEHGGIIGRFGAGELEIGAAHALEGREGIRLAVIPRPRQRRFEQRKAPQRHTGYEFVAVAEMPVGRCRADAGESCRLRKGEPGRPLAGDQVERRADQRLLEIAVMVAARRRPLVAIPRHVKRVYIAGTEASSGLLDAGAANAWGGAEYEWPEPKEVATWKVYYVGAKRTVQATDEQAAIAGG